MKWCPLQTNDDRGVGGTSALSAPVVESRMKGKDRSGECEMKSTDYWRSLLPNGTKSIATAYVEVCTSMSETDETGGAAVIMKEHTTPCKNFGRVP